jgi:hypothetical protein
VTSTDVLGNHRVLKSATPAIPRAKPGLPLEHSLTRPRFDKRVCSLQMPACVTARTARPLSRLRCGLGSRALQAVVLARGGPRCSTLLVAAVAQSQRCSGCRPGWLLRGCSRNVPCALEDGRARARCRSGVTVRTASRPWAVLPARAPRGERARARYRSTQQARHWLQTATAPISPDCRHAHGWRRVLAIFSASPAARSSYARPRGRSARGRGMQGSPSPRRLVSPPGDRASVGRLEGRCLRSSRLLTVSA